MSNVLLLAPYIFVPILLENNICISDILRILVCDMVAMPGTLIPFAVIFYFSDYVCTLLLQTIVVKCYYVPKKVQTRL